MRTKIIAGNWKMNTSLSEAYTLARGVLHDAEHIERIVTVLCPPTIWLTELAHEVIPPGCLPHLKLGAQNMHDEDSGAFTGEASPAMIKEVAEYVILGHSERTHLFHEGIDFISSKVYAAFRYGLQPILCVGEDERQEHAMRQVIHRINHLVKDLKPEQVEKLIVAYEPVWAIGTGEAAEPEYAQRVMQSLRTMLSPKTRILYGGSVNEENAEAYLKQADCDGLLIGGTSLKLKPFLKICQIADDLAATASHPSLHT